ncbi:MAG: ABC transporter permease [Lentisphaerae bacterium]|nr:ABC transporter permease [Lentisphaerota bacterium]
MLALALNEITRRRGRAFLAIVGFLLVALLVAAGHCLGQAIRKATAEPMEVTGADLVVVRQVIPCAFAVVKLPKDLGAITADEVRRIGAVPGVRAVAGSLVVWAFHDGQPTVVTGVVPGSVKTGPLRQYRDGERCCVLESGRLFDPSRNEAVLDKEYADQLGVSVGSTVHLGPREFTVCGILKVAGVAVIGGGQAYVPLQALQEMLGEGDVVDYVFVSAEADADLAAISAGIEAIIGEGCQVSTQDSLPGQISRSAAVTAAGSGAFVALIVVIGGLLVVRSALAAVRERVVEIGILRAVGWRRRHVVALLGWETILQGVLGAVPGVAIGYAVAFLICSQLNLSLPASFNSYPPCATTEPALALTLQPQVTLAGVGLALLITVALALAAGLIAGRYAASRAPMDSLRQP